MSKSTISTFELFQIIPDAEAARLYLEFICSKPLSGAPQ